ncbi:hypothetical protein N7456_009038 [Penicillium angulare]|uniref:Uncharacterized protein n=1 Tax=Penicillium angulare TaxID=116970 RepID=A0A9W9F426_9EURO|nr:hypothetical protein N7456_009038 [Penicillium angulare]
MALLFPGVALVTGAASGIGQGIAVAFAKDGCSRIALCDINVSGLEETKLLVLQVAPEAQVLVVYVDLSKEQDVKEMVHKTVQKFGRVDYAVNTAGM